ncbi:Bacterial surface proteins containing Ig-like domains [Butyrivibrio fibrisolvens 16/4]|nr:Bacterial surface proteins containing Ig-like domains [Butyrivibrio fibrisolvens 16/4]
MARNKTLVRFMAIAVAATTLSTSAPAYAAFDADYYAKQNPDVVAAFGSSAKALENHYNLFGKNEGRAGSSEDLKNSPLRQLFDASFYAKQNPDVVAAFGNNEDALFQHFLIFGIKEGRQINQYFDVKAYKAAYPDLSEKFGDNMELYYKHFVAYGQKEHRTLGGFPSENILPSGKTAVATASAAKTSGSSSSSSSGGSSSKPTPTPAVDPDKTTLSDLTIAVGEKATLSINNPPAGATAAYESSDTEIADFDSDDKLVGKKAGTATITVTFDDEDSTKCSCTVTVNEGYVKLSTNTLTVAVGGNESLTATGFVGSNITSDIILTTNDPSVAKISSGSVQGIKAGTATITARYVSADGIEYTDTCAVTVTAPSIKLDKTSLTVEVGKDTDIHAITLPTSETVAWKSDNTNIVTVASGKVTGVAAGTATIIASIQSGKYEARCNVTVQAPTPKIELAKDKATLKVGENVDLGQDKTTVPASGLLITWSSSSSSVATVDSAGVVTGKTVGKATITASITVNGKTYTDSCEVTVEPTPEVKLSKNTETVIVGNTITLSATTIPADEEITWTSDDTDIATVSGGVVTGVAAGTATITATITVDGSDYTDTCAVTVTATTP